jgi:hypothetical protein
MTDDTPLNHLVLLYKKCNCIRIMSLNIYNKNVDIIWHYYIISQIKQHGFWKRSALTNMRKDALNYMINRLWYGIFHITCHINPRPILTQGPTGISGWYDMWYEKCHIIIYEYRLGIYNQILILFININNWDVDYIKHDTVKMVLHWQFVCRL